jgi:hypothetical protein
MTLRQNDADGGTWGLAMTTHGSLKMTTAPFAYLGEWHAALAPLGNYEKIRAFIETELYNARLRAPGNVLPSVIELYTPESEIPIIVPDSLGAQTILTLQHALASPEGLAALEPVLQAFQGTINTTTEMSEAADAYAASLPDDMSEEDRLAAVAEWRRENGGAELGSAEMETLLTNLLAEEGFDAEERETEIARASSGLTSSGHNTDASVLTTAQNYAAIATVLGSIAEVCVTAGSQEGTTGSHGLDVAVRVLDVLGTVCSAAAVACSSVPIAGAILVVIGLVCKFIAMVLDAIREYTTSPMEGYRASWDRTDMTFILKERLRILVQVDERVIDSTDAGWRAHWTEAMRKKGIDATGQFDVLTFFIEQTSRSQGEARVANAKAIAQLLGGRDATKSFNMCEDISNWLTYVGVPAERVEMIHTWLYEARKVSTVRARRIALGTMVGSNAHGGTTGYGTEYRGNMVHYIGTASDCKEKHPCQEWHYGHSTPGNCAVNFAYGTEAWYATCCALPATDFNMFSEDQLETLWKNLRAELRVTTVYTTPPRGPTFTDFILTEARKQDLVGLICPTATATQKVAAVAFSLRSLGRVYDGALALPGVRKSALAPAAQAGAVELIFGDQVVTVWGNVNAGDAWFISNTGGGLIYLAYLPGDTEIPGYARAVAGQQGYKYGIPRADGSWFATRDAALRTMIAQMFTLNSTEFSTVPTGGRGLLIGGAVIAAGVVAALLIPK